MAFTLIELLVVITLIAILATLLLPTLAAAKLQASSVQCISNQRQMILAWTVYAGDNDDHLVLNGGDAAAISLQPHLWVYGGNHGSPEALTNDVYLTGVDYALFAKLIPAERIYKCPADYSTWPLWGTASPSPAAYVTELRSYSLNCYMGANELLSPITINPAYKTYSKMSQVSADSPANRFVFMDVNPASICTPAFGVDMTELSWIHYPSDLHRQRGMIIFADSHAEAHRWVDPRTLVHLSQGTSIPHGVFSPNNPDLDWIADHTTSPN